MGEIYQSTFCNKGHDVKTGRPIDHDCVRLNVVKFALEREQKFKEIVGSIVATEVHVRKDRNT